MKSTDLRQLIRESINEYIREIDHAGETAAVAAKIAKIGEAITSREKKMNMEGIDEAYHDMIDKGKMKELASEVKTLKKSLAKYEKQLDKLKNKGKKSEEVEEKEVIDEAPEMEVKMDETDSQLEEAKKKKAAKKEKEMMNESFLYMQKLAGIITESEYKNKLEENKFSDLVKNVFTSKTKKAEEKEKMAKAAAEAAEQAERLSKSKEEIDKLNVLSNNNEFKTLLNNFATQYTEEFDKFEREIQSIYGDRGDTQYFMSDFYKRIDPLAQPLKDFLKKNNINPEFIVRFEEEMFKKSIKK